MARSKLVGAVALGAAFLGGGVAGAVLATPALTAAQEEAPTTEAPTTEAPDDTTPQEPNAAKPGVEEDDGHGCHIGRHWFRPGLDVAAEALGITEDELLDSLRDGRSIADVAEERGVDPQTVIDALVAAATAHIDDEVAEGDLDADRAAELKERLAERVAGLVEREGLPARGGPGHGPGRGWGRGPR